MNFIPTFRKATIKLLIVGLLTLFMMAGSLMPAAKGHLDPPGPPAYLERVLVLDVDIADDTDPFGAGEIFSVFTLTPSPGHGAPFFVRYPPLGAVPNYSVVSAPPPVLVPMPPGGLSVWWHPNCEPIESPVGLTAIVYDDDDAGGAVPPAGDVEASMMVSIIGLTWGISTVVTPDGSLTYAYLVIPRPEWNELCAPHEPRDDRNDGNFRFENAIDRIEPGSSSSMRYEIINTQDNKMPFSVKVEGIQPLPAPQNASDTNFVGNFQMADNSWFETPTDEITLDPLQSITGQIKINIPLGTPAGFYAFSGSLVSSTDEDLGTAGADFAVIEVGTESKIGLPVSKIYDIVVDGKEFGVKVSGNGVSSVALDKNSKTLSIENDGASGGLRLVIPRALLDGPFVGTADDQQLDFETTVDKDTSTLEFDRPSDTNKILITGTTVIPEFPLAGIVLMISLLLAIVVNCHLKKAS